MSEGRTGAAGGGLPPSGWLLRCASLISPRARVLDVASGAGRHARLLRDLGHSVLAVDRDETALAALAGESGIQTLCADLESDPWPFDPDSFDAVVVTNYLHRPLFPFLRQALRSGGVLIYETFAKGNERFGRPRNPDFLLRCDELLALVMPLQVLAFEQGIVGAPAPAVVQRICAVKAEKAGELGSPIPVIPVAGVGALR